MDYKKVNCGREKESPKEEERLIGCIKREGASTTYLDGWDQWGHKMRAKGSHRQAKRVKCMVCGLYYNSLMYSSCPHCKSGERLECQKCGKQYNPRLWSECPDCKVAKFAKRHYD
jgi:predicted Zn-ribbon and HTH transcriptional regulator